MRFRKGKYSGGGRDASSIRESEEYLYPCGISLFGATQNITDRLLDD
jgi:hypothetical protein